MADVNQTLIEVLAGGTKGLYPPEAAKQVVEEIQKNLGGALKAIPKATFDKLLGPIVAEFEASVDAFADDFDGEIEKFAAILEERTNLIVNAVKSNVKTVNIGSAGRTDILAGAAHTAIFSKILNIVRTQKPTSKDELTAAIKEHLDEMLEISKSTEDEVKRLNVLVDKYNSYSPKKSTLKIVPLPSPIDTGDISGAAAAVKKVSEGRKKQAADAQKEIDDLRKEIENLRADSENTQNQGTKQGISDNIRTLQKRLNDLTGGEMSDNAKGLMGLINKGVKRSTTAGSEEPPTPPAEIQTSSAEPPTPPAPTAPKPRRTDADAPAGPKSSQKISHQYEEKLSEAYADLFSAQSLWTSSLEDSINQIQYSARALTEDMLLQVTEEIRRSITSKFKVIGKQIEDAFGGINGVGTLGVKLDEINLTLTEIKNGLVKRNYLEESVLHRPTDPEVNIPHLAEMLGDATVDKLAGQPFFNPPEKYLGFNKGGIVPGTGSSDSVRALLTPGELVVNPRYLENGTLDTFYRVQSKSPISSLVEKYLADGGGDWFEDLNWRLQNKIIEHASDGTHKMHGRYFGASIEQLKWYLNDANDPSTQIIKILNLPKEFAEQFRVSNLVPGTPEYEYTHRGKRRSIAGNEEYFFPHDVVSGSRMLDGAFVNPRRLEGGTSSLYLRTPDLRKDFDYMEEAYPRMYQILHGLSSEHINRDLYKNHNALERTWVQGVRDDILKNAGSFTMNYLLRRGIKDPQDMEGYEWDTGEAAKLWSTLIRKNLSNEMFDEWLKGHGKEQGLSGLWAFRGGHYNEDAEKGILSWSANLRTAYNYALQSRSKTSEILAARLTDLPFFDAANPEQHELISPIGSMMRTVNENIGSLHKMPIRQVRLLKDGTNPFRFSPEQMELVGLDYIAGEYKLDLSKFKENSQNIYRNPFISTPKNWGYLEYLSNVFGERLQDVTGIQGTGGKQRYYKPFADLRERLRNKAPLSEDDMQEIAFFDKHIRTTSGTVVNELLGSTLFRGLPTEFVPRKGGIMPVDPAYTYMSLSSSTARNYGNALLKSQITDRFKNSIGYIGSDELQFILSRNTAFVSDATDKAIDSYGRVTLEAVAEPITKTEAAFLKGTLSGDYEENWPNRFKRMVGSLSRVPLIQDMFPDKLAAGGPLMPGQTAVVGEKGPELLVPAGRGFHVIPNPMFKTMGGARFLAGGTTDQTMDAHNVKWAPDYVKDFAEGIAFMTSEALVDSISAEVGPEYRSAAGGLLKSLKVSLHDIAKGDYTGEKQKSPDMVEMLRLQGGKTVEVLGRAASSLRYFVTGMLIANHVVRLLTATSKVYNSAMNAAGSGWGYILDAILLPLTPLIAPLMGGLMMIGNFFRANAWAAWTAIIAGFAAAITIAGYSIWKMKADIEKAAAAFERFTAAMEGREYVPPEVKKGYASRAADWAKDKWQNKGKPSPWIDDGTPWRKVPTGDAGKPIHDKRPWQSGWTSGEEPIEMGSGQDIIPRMRWYNPERPTDVGPVRKNSTYGEQYPRSSGNWATTYDEDGNPIVNKLYKIKKDLKHYLLGGKVGETGLAVLHAGELVVPANVINNIPHFAEGGVMGAAGSFGDWFMGAASGFASMAAGGISGLLTNPAIQGIFTGLRVISATLGAVMAPIAMVGGGIAAAMAASNKGMGVLSRIIGKSGEAQMEVAGNVGRAQRNLLTLINIELLAVVGGVLALLAAVAELKGAGEVGFDVAKLAAGFVNGLLSKWGQFVDDLIKGAGRFVDDLVKALIGKESFLGSLVEKLIGKEGFIPALLEKLFGKESFLGKFIDELVKGSKTFVDDLLTKLLGKEGGFMAGIIEKLVGKEGGFIPKLLEKLVAGGGIVAGALSKAGEIGGGVLGKAGEYLGKAGEFLGFGKGAPFYAKGIKPTIGYIIGELLGGAAMQYAGGQGADQGYTGGMVGFRPDLAQGSNTTFAAGSAELLMSFLPKLWPAISAFNLIGQYQYGKESAEGRLPEGMDYGKYKEYRINVAAEQLADWWETTSASIKAVFDGMATWWNDSWNTLSTSLGTVFGSIATGIMDAWNNAVAAISSFFTVENLKNMIMSALPGVLGVGAGVVKTSGDIIGGIGDLIGFKNGGLTTAEGIAYLHANEAIIPLSSVSNGSTNSRSDSRTMQITNHNTFEIKRDDDYLLFQRFQQFMANEQRRYTL